MLVWVLDLIMRCQLLKGCIRRVTSVTHVQRQLVIRRTSIYCKKRFKIRVHLIFHATDLIKLINFKNFSEVVNLFVHNREYGQYACQILTDGINRPKKGVDVGDHPPITPMKSATCTELDGDCFKIYDYIVRHFLGSVSDV